MKNLGVEPLTNGESMNLQNTPIDGPIGCFKISFAFSKFNAMPKKMPKTTAITLS